MKTIAELASEIGVSKQAIHQKIKQEPLSTDLRQFTSIDGNTLTVDENGENLIKSAFANVKITVSTTDKLIDSMQAQIDLLTEQIEKLNSKNDELQNELSKEREHSRNITERLAMLTENAQKLQAAQITDGNNKKSGLFSRLFGKKDNQE